MSDKAIRDFTNYFYKFLLVQNLRPCEAFKKAKDEFERVSKIDGSQKDQNYNL